MPPLSIPQNSHNHDSGYLGMAVQLYVQAHLRHYHILTQKEYSQKLIILRDTEGGRMPPLSIPQNSHNHDSGYLGMAVQLYVQAHLRHYHILTQKEYSQKLIILRDTEGGRMPPLSIPQYTLLPIQVELSILKMITLNRTTRTTILMQLVGIVIILRADDTACFSVHIATASTLHFAGTI